MIQNSFFEISFGSGAGALWTYRDSASGRTHDLGVPRIEIDGEAVDLAVAEEVTWREPQGLANGGTEHVCEARVSAAPDLVLTTTFRVAAGSPVVRFRYALHSTAGNRLTKSEGRDAAAYGGIGLDGLARVLEIRFSEFRETLHSFSLSELDVTDRQFEHGLGVMGPLLVANDAEHALLLAYEHGSMTPDAFVEFRLRPERGATLRAVKGNYYHGQALTAEQPFESVWFQFAAINGTVDELAAAYREFILKHQSVNTESRKPYIFYNTWAGQERNKHWNDDTYLGTLHQEHTLNEIDTAHRMGVEVFVIDTGWYQKTGDWEVNLDRFPDGLKAIKAKLDGYGMKLGLWFDPCSAAVSSQMLANHDDCRVSWEGRFGEPHSIWETEPSVKMCLVSRYSEAFADELIRLVREVGVTYFKWDAIHQYGCDDPAHDHGGAENSHQERADCYAFELGRAMNRVVDKLCRECPEAIVDFDITEPGRYVGLGFLAAGKYFLINNGPYFSSFDFPESPVPWTNIFVHPGEARPRLCRETLSFDKWIPSILYLTHYLPDDPADSQITNIASLILGHNGIWGDLKTVSEPGIERFSRLLGLYKQVRDDITASSPVRYGVGGGNPEVHEKVNPETGRGAVVVFSAVHGNYNYVSFHKVQPEFVATDGVTVSFDEQGRAVLRVEFEKAGAKIVYFGVRE